MSVPSTFWSLAPFSTVPIAVQAALAAAATEVPFLADQILQTDEDHVAVLIDGAAVLHRLQDVERIVVGPVVLDLLHPGAGRPARFHALSTGTLVWVPRSAVDAATRTSERLAVSIDQSRDERADLAALADRQTWVGPPSGATLSQDPYVGELDYVMIGVASALSQLVPSLPSGCVPIHGDGRVILVFGFHGPSSLFSGYNPPAKGGHAAVLVPVEWSGRRGLYCATVWTGQLMYVHVVRELYGMMAREGQVYEPLIAGQPQRLMAWGRRLRLRARWAASTVPNPNNWEDMTGLPWDPARMELHWRFRRHSFGVGPRFDRGCDGHLEMSLLNFEELIGPTVESLDGLTLPSPGAILYGFRVQADFRLADPNALDSALLARLSAWLVG